METSMKAEVKRRNIQSSTEERVRQKDPIAFDALAHEWLPPEESAALVPLRHDVVQGPKKPIAGYVEVISATEISGWAVDTEDANPLNVCILVNDQPLVTVTADRERPDVAKVQSRSKAGFKFVPGTDLRGLLPDNATISVRAGSADGPVLQSKGVKLSNPGCTSLDTLQSMLASGFKVSAKSGSLFRPIANIPGAFDQFIQAYWHAENQFRSLFNTDLFVAYGTLLGLTRENSLLPHDDDFDIAFCIDAKDHKDAAQQFWSIILKLREAGERIEEYADGHFHWKRGSATLDVFVWWRTNRELNGYFLHSTNPALLNPISVSASKFQNRSVLAPDSRLDLLAEIYGPDWQTPKPNFQWNVPEVVTARMGAFRAAFNEVSANAGKAALLRQSAGHWDQFYSGSHTNVPSQFAVFASTLLNADTSVLELGCGNGRDAFFFASLGHRVVGVDASKTAIASNRKRATGANPRFEAIDLSDTENLISLVSDLSPEMNTDFLCVYSRFFLHAVDETVERNIISAVRRLNQFKRLMFVAEFRTTKDALLPKEFGHHYRRYIDHSRLSQDLTSQGFKVSYAYEGQGMAKYKDEDPFVARIVSESLR